MQYWSSSYKKLFLEILLNSQENICARVSILIGCGQSSLQFYYKRLRRRCFPVNLVKSLRTSILKNWSVRAIGEKHLKQIRLVNLLSIKVSGSSLNAFSELLFVKLCHNDKNYQLNQKKREIRKRKAKPVQKDFEFLSLFKTSSKSKLLSDNDLWRDLYFHFVFWNLNY